MVKALRFTSLLVLWIAFTLMMVSTIHASPKIQVDQAVYDAGQSPEGKEVTHEFILKNVGDQKLIFKAKHC